MKNKPVRFFLDQDNSGHWYLVRAERRNEWAAWLELDEDDERSWSEPEFSTRLNGSQVHVEFENPKDTNG